MTTNQSNICDLLERNQPIILYELIPPELSVDHSYMRHYILTVSELCLATPAERAGAG